MANRYAPYKARYLTREPKVVICKFTHNSNAEQLPNDSATNTTLGLPFNKGIYSVKRTAAGIYQFHLGTRTTNNTAGHVSTMVDPYAFLADVRVTFSETGLMAFVSNDQSSNATTPFVELTMETTAAGTDTNVGAGYTTVRFEFLDSKD